MVKKRIIREKIGSNYYVYKNKQNLFTLYYKSEIIQENVSSFALINKGIQTRDKNGEITTFDKGIKGPIQLRLI